MSGSGLLALPLLFFDVVVPTTIALMVILDLFLLWCGVGMLRRRRAAYVAYLVSIPVTMAFGLVQLVGSDPGHQSLGQRLMPLAGGCLLYGIIVWVLTRPPVREWFRRPGDRARERTA
jgi:hypothetical protein